MMMMSSDKVYIGRSVFTGPGASVNAWDSNVTSLGGNVANDSQLLWGANDRQNTAVLLGPLQDNGGPTRTFMPMSGSPVLGWATCGATVDQRGVSRPTSQCAAGSMEGPSCGNGVVESGEDCDGTACCSASCTFASAGTACGDATDTACNGADTCDGAGACLANQARRRVVRQRRLLRRRGHLPRGSARRPATRARLTRPAGRIRPVRSPADEVEEEVDGEEKPGAVKPGKQSRGDGGALVTVDERIR